MNTSDAYPPPEWLRIFVQESNRIENIKDTIGADIQAHVKLLALTQVKVQDLEVFVRTITRDHVLRDKIGLDVRVGNYFPPRGGPEIKDQLYELLITLHRRSSFENHLIYEAMHPFTDGNGRSGRALWLWQVLKAASEFHVILKKESFLDTFARQAKDAGCDLFVPKRALYFHMLSQGLPPATSCRT